eukprot:SM001831S04164  [mRNA]  locus=s1831:1630:1824:- [translate_table: standard]
MAVFGDVVRPGLQCRCQTVAEALGVAAKAKRSQAAALAACQLPYRAAAPASDDAPAPTYEDRPQ